MKILPILLAFCIAFVAPTANAGLFGKLLKGGALVGAGAMIGRSVSANSPEGKRLKKMNSYVWKALQNNELYRKNLRFYISELEDSDSIGMADTASYGYAVLGERAKAVETYEQRILPYLDLEDNKVQRKYKHWYQVVKICEPRNCMNDRDSSISQVKQSAPRKVSVEDELKQLNYKTWQSLKQNTQIEDRVLYRLARTNQISMADTASFGFVVKSQREVGVKIYEDQILPQLASATPAIRAKYEKAYDIIKTCDPAKCMQYR